MGHNSCLGINKITKKSHIGVQELYKMFMKLLLCKTITANYLKAWLKKIRSRNNKWAINYGAKDSSNAKIQSKGRREEISNFNQIR